MRTIIRRRLVEASCKTGISVNLRAASTCLIYGISAPTVSCTVESSGENGAVHWHASGVCSILLTYRHTIF